MVALPTTPYLLALLAATVVSGATAAFVRLQGSENDETVRALFWMIAFAFLWSGFTLGEYLVSTHQLEVVFAKASYVGITGLTPALFVFALLYSGRERYVNRLTVGLLAVEPVLANALVWTTERHGLWYPVVDGALELSEHGAAFWVHVAYGQVLTLGAVALLLDVIRRQQSLFQRQSLAVGFAALVPLVMNVVEVTGTVDVEITPIGFSLSGLALLWAVVRADLTALSPVARDRIVAEMTAGAIVLNADDIVVDVNPRMRAILGVGADEDVVGRPIGAVLEDYEAIREQLRSQVQGDGEVTVDTDEELRHYSVAASPLHDHRERQIGRLFLVYDVTEQKRRERELERKNEQLDRFASLVSHDLRNPLNVADGMLDMAEETGDPEQFQEVREMHDRMGRLIDDLLTLAREGEAVEDVAPVDLEEVVREAWGNVDTGAATLASDCRGSVVRADRSRLLQVFENLFRNSVEHAIPPDGDRGDLTVSVGPLRPDGEPVDPRRKGFYVEDDGVGIPEEKRDSALEHGYTTNEDGTGLGLSIVDQIVRAHGWTVEVAESESGGARFEVRNVASLEERREAEPPGSGTHD